VELSGVVPLPVSVAGNTAAAFHPLMSHTPLARVVRTLLAAVAEPDRIVVVTAEPLAGDVRTALASEDLASVNVVAVKGSATRADCLDTALEHLRRGSFSTSHILLHDITSPLASTDVTQRVVSGMGSGGTVVLPGLAVTDSVKAVDARGSVTATVDRSMLRAIQFPRGFAVETLAELLAERSSEDIDEIAAAIGTEAPITFVDGDNAALRAELPRDAEFFEAIIASR
jgi:2-C-methyl-D-erythritol 4-phosphate cytidylyltransferase